MKKLTLALMAIAGLVCASTAFAGGNGWYVWGAAGQTTNDSTKRDMDSALTSAGAVGFASAYNKPTIYKLQAGYQVNDYFAAEGGYIGSNNANYTATGGNLVGALTASANISGWNLTAVGILPIANQFSLLGKLGVADIRTSATVTGGGITVSANGSKTDLTGGIGAKYDFANNAHVRFDIDSYKIGNSSSSSRMNVWTVGVGYKF